MNKTYKDTDLREALRRKYSDTPQLPADFMAKMEARLDAKPVAKTRHLWRWVAAAACFLLIIGVGFTLLSQHDQPSAPVLAKVTQQPKPQAPEQPTQQAAPEQPQQQQQAPEQPKQPAPEVKPESKAKATPLDDEPQSDPNLHYAAYELTNDTIPYQDPARVDDFIEKLAENYQVKQSELNCSLPVDSSVVSTVYVFPDKDEINLFGRLLQMACWYNNEMPGYHLNFSQQQFFFELKDMRRQLHYRWIAERINGRILFYSAHAPLGTKASSACYQQYRNGLMYQNSINIKNKKI